MKALRLIIPGLLAIAVCACVHDPEEPFNLPDLPTLSVDETSVTRVSMVLGGSFGSNMTDITAYGVEISETLFESGGTYKTLVPQEMGADGFSLGVSDLKSNSTYFLRAFISNGHSRMYSTTLTQKTPETSVASISDVTLKDDYYLVATIEDNGGRSIEDVGFMWSTSAERKDIKREKRYPATLSGDGKTFTLPVNEVGEGTHYIMAYAEDDKDGTGYSRIPFEWVVTSDQGVAIEDPNFKKYLLMYHDGNEDGKMSYAEMEAIESIDVHTDNIKSVREINMMPRLHSLVVSGTQQGSGQLTSLDMSKNTGLSALDCSNNKLTSLDVSALPELDMLYCQGNSLYTLDVSKNSHLHHLNCLNNPMDTLFMSYYQELGMLQYPEGTVIKYVDAPAIPENPTIQPDNEIWYTTTDGKVVTLSSDHAFDAAVVSNTYENGKGIIRFDGNVTTMTNYAFYGDNLYNSNLKSISFPETLQTFEAGLYGCEELESIHLPSHLKSIPGHFLVMHNKLRELEFPETDSIAENWMNGPIALCSNLEKLTGPYATDDNKALIKDGKMFAFAGAGMTSYTVPEGVTSFSGDLFRGFQLEYVHFPNTLQSIGNDCFTDTPLRELALPESVTLIKSGAFMGCHNLKSVYLPSGTDIETSVFDQCELLESFSGHYATEDGRCLIKQTSTYTALLAFAPAGLTEYSVPEGVTFIEISFGYGNYGLESLTIPQSVSRLLGPSSSTIKTLTCLSETPPTLLTNMSLNSIEAIYVPAASVDAYKSAQYWSDYADRIQPIQEQGGNVLPDFTAQKYLTFASDGTTTISLENYSGNAPALYYSFDAQSWMQWDYSALSFSTNKPLYLCGINPDGFSLNYDSFSQFSFGGNPFTVSGDIMSLINKDQDVDTLPSVYCFQRLFYGSYIKSAPSLPATNLTEGCYSEMFENCIYLTAAPSLPATILAPGCYQFMFHGCTYLVTAPELPATSLAIACYQSMFRLCTSLESAPELSAAVALPEKAYNKMFADCEHINYIKCLAADVTATDCVVGWLSGVSESGTFVKSADAQGWIEGYDGIPVGWTVLNDGQQQGGISATKYLYISSIGNSTLSFFSEGDNAPVLYYSFDRVQWTQWDFSPLEISNDFPVYIFGDNPQGFSHNPQVYSSFVVEGADIIVIGSVMSLLNGNEELLTIPCDYCFYRLFADCVPLYTAPSLPATTLTTGCYAGMFSGCSRLYHLPEELPAQTLAEQCYADMFSGCLLLTGGPDLWAASLPAGCYARMFQGCLVLSDITCRATEFLSDTCTEDWLDGVAENGIFHCAAGVQWPSGPSGIPEGWEVQAN